jgi:uncharacterized protein
VTTTDGHGDAAVGFHSGELAVQELAGVGRQAGRLSNMVARGQLRSGTADFLSTATYPKPTRCTPFPTVSVSVWS